MAQTVVPGLVSTAHRDPRQRKGKANEAPPMLITAVEQNSGSPPALLPVEKEMIR
jgi:hypothetical protein